ncbi:PREDICTED: isoprenoid synthase domain-containing protein-like [Acropora digitifera]|uniref:isoprenoid synthase domain-containing protein-like n=1 Tax=Acropora digitifera TaxID=70779 RepID=UPI00077AA57B|nr:PREDICTED: isoprenoid synthase domain-containing protein-like [Acropora digitifera]
MAACENLTRMSEVCFDVVAVLPAGGCGTRMNMGLPKQFHLVLGRPLISYTLAAFESVPWIKEIVVPISENYVKEGQQILKEFLHTKVRLTPGGTTRHRSIFSGIQALTVDGRSPPSVVILHDAVRPFVDEETLHCVTKVANKHGAAGVIRPLVSTVIAQSSDGFLDHSLDRSKYRASEMPQAFRYEIIKKAYEQCTENDLEYGTECLHLVQEYCETRPLLIDGPESLWKVTYRKDLYSLEGILREKLCHPVVVVGKDCFNFFSELSVILQRRNALVTRLEDVPKNEELLIEKVVCMKLEIHTYYIFIATEFAIITREVIQPLETLLRTCFARSTWFYYEKKASALSLAINESQRGDGSVQIRSRIIKLFEYV